VAESETIDDYELINCIATGNATQIWEVRKGGGTQSLAMKILLPEAFKDPEQKSSLKHEANIAKSLEHPNIIRLIESKFTRKHGYFVMEYFRGGNLKSLIRNDRDLVLANAKKVIECLSQALGFMHEKKWIHRDVKPDNVMVTRGGEVRLIDFSLTSRAGNAVAHALTKKRSIVIAGTRTYLAPELIRRELLTHSVDIYGLGVLFYEILVGHPPFRHGNPNELLMMHVRDTPAPPTMFDSNITPEAEKFILRLLAKYPKDRHANMQEVFAEIRNLNVFHQDPVEHLKAKRTAFATSDAESQNDRLNSRKDAERTASGVPLPAAPPKAKPKIVIPEEKPAARPAIQPPAAAMSPQPVPFPGGFAPYPGMAPHPGMPHPGTFPMGMPMQGFPMQPGMPMPFPGYPGMPMPGMPMPGAPMPGMPAAGMPGMFPPGTGMPVPGLPFPGAGVPVPGQPQSAIPPAQPVPAAAPQRPAPPPADDTPLASIDDLEIM